ncbi:MAG: 5-methyltetrahydropteroyltriglutamate--homocysteine methyltransferase [Betaproteobacteria bacterium]|nr:5-methyltetrahydropteroyltriglutamate--homocysteine methyltransferase [Betaproteobacteria bacterium]
MNSAKRLLPTTLVGSYPQPGWLVDKEKLLGSSPPRVRMREVWRFAGEVLHEAQDDAVRLALADQERAGIDIVTDGEMRRESYFNHFANALSGIDLDRPATTLNRVGKKTCVPRVVGPIRRERAVEVEALRFLKANAKGPVKITVPGPFTLTQLAVDEHYGDERKLALAYAQAVNEELRDLENAGADYLQLDEPYMQAQPEKARRFAIEAIDRALEGIRVPTIVHLCFGYAYVVADKPSGYSFLPELAKCRCDQISIEAAQPKLDPSVLKSLPGKTILFGALDLASKDAETPELVAKRIRGALEHVAPERLVVAPDCGMKYLPRELAFAKLSAMTAGARIVRAELR